VGELRREREEAEEGRRAAEADSQQKQKAVVELEEKLLEKNKRIQVKYLLQWNLTRVPPKVPV
jgi:hypothetical protein